MFTSNYAFHEYSVKFYHLIYINNENAFNSVVEN